MFITFWEKSVCITREIFIFKIIFLVFKVLGSDNINLQPKLYVC